MVYYSRSYDDDFYGDFHHKKDRKIVLECKKIDKKHDCDHKRDFHRKDDWKDHDKKDEKKAQCFVATHSVGVPTPVTVTIPGGQTVTVFEDLTKNHNKTFISLNPNGTINVVIRTRGKKECDRPIMIAANTTKMFQVEDFKELVITNLPGADVDIATTIQKTFCICCKDENNKKHKKHDDDDCGCDFD